MGEHRMTHTMPRLDRPDRNETRTIVTFQTGNVKEEANRLASEIDGLERGTAAPLLLDFRHVGYVMSEDLVRLLACTDASRPMATA